MDKSKFTALRTLLNGQPVDSDVRPDAAQDEPRLLNELELLLAAGGDEIPHW